MADPAINARTADTIKYLFNSDSLGVDDRPLTVNSTYFESVDDDLLEVLFDGVTPLFLDVTAIVFAR